MDTYKLWNDLIKGLNSIDPKYTFIKANLEGNKLSYPYGTVNILNPYIQDMDTTKGTLTRSASTDNTKVKITRTETPKIVFSINCLSNKMQSCLDMLKATQEYLIFAGKQYLNEYDIIILDIGNIQDRTIFLETEYEYRFGFDLTVRTTSTITLETDNISDVDVKNENN